MTTPAKIDIAYNSDVHIRRELYVLRISCRIRCSGEQMDDREAREHLSCVPVLPESASESLGVALDIFVPFVCCVAEYESRMCRPIAKALLNIVSRWNSRCRSSTRKRDSRDGEANGVKNLLSQANRHANGRVQASGKPDGCTESKAMSKTEANPMRRRIVCFNPTQPFDRAV